LARERGPVGRRGYLFRGVSVGQQTGEVVIWIAIIAFAVIAVVAFLAGLFVGAGIPDLGSDPHRKRRKR
jgi:hypothetical protein